MMMDHMLCHHSAGMVCSLTTTESWQDSVVQWLCSILMLGKLLSVCGFEAFLCSLLFLSINSNNKDSWWIPDGFLQNIPGISRNGVVWNGNGLGMNQE